MTFGYTPDHMVLHDLTLSAKPGQKLAFVGYTGAGKTTIFGLLLKFLEPQHGSIELDGRPFEQWPLGQLRRRLAYVEQDTPLVPGTLRDNLTYAAPAATPAAIHAALETVRLAARVEALPNGLDTEVSGAVLSGGERQRVALARALVNHPEVLLLDEPLGALDLKLRREMQVELKRIQTEVGLTFIHVTHDQEEAMTMADTVAVMNKGRIEQLGPPAQLYDLPRTRFVANFLGQANTGVGTIEGKDFADALLKVWLGADPVQSDIKDGMLGK